jgi:hypothetical protein
VRREVLHRFTSLSRLSLAKVWARWASLVRVHRAVQLENEVLSLKATLQREKKDRSCHMIRVCVSQWSKRCVARAWGHWCGYIVNWNRSVWTVHRSLRNTRHALLLASFGHWHRLQFQQFRKSVACVEAEKERAEASEFFRREKDSVQRQTRSYQEKLEAMHQLLSNRQSPQQQTQNSRKYLQRAHERLQRKTPPPPVVSKRQNLSEDRAARDLKLMLSGGFYRRSPLKQTGRWEGKSPHSLSRALRGPRRNGVESVEGSEDKKPSYRNQTVWDPVRKVYRRKEEESPANKRRKKESPARQSPQVTPRKEQQEAAVWNLLQARKRSPEVTPVNSPTTQEPHWVLEVARLMQNDAQAGIRRSPPKYRGRPQR